jgi:hypothetical protein
MKETVGFSPGVTSNLAAACLSAFFTAVLVYFWTNSFWWAFAAYSLCGAVYLFLYMVLWGYDLEYRQKQLEYRQQEESNEND